MHHRNNFSSVCVMTTLLPALLSAMSLPIARNIDLEDFYRRLAARDGDPNVLSEGNRAENDQNHFCAADMLGGVVNPGTYKVVLEDGGAISNNIQCAQGNGCEIAREESESTGFSMSVNVGFDLAGGSAAMTGGISASFGYEVTKETSSGEAAVCAAENGDTACGWWREAHTAFKVRDIDYCYSEETGRSEVYTVLVPNKNSQGSAFICGITTPDKSTNQCRHKSYEFWNDNGNPAGGPQSFPASTEGHGGLLPPVSEADLAAESAAKQSCWDEVNAQDLPIDQKAAAIYECTFSEGA